MASETLMSSLANLALLFIALGWYHYELLTDELAIIPICGVGPEGGDLAWLYDYDYGGYY